MARFLVDEDMPRSTAAMLRGLGFIADDVRDVGLRGRNDASVFAFAQSVNAVIVTADVGFGNVLRFPLGHHSGIVLLRLPTEMSNSNGMKNLAGRCQRSIQTFWRELW